MSKIWQKNVQSVQKFSKYLSYESQVHFYAIKQKGKFLENVYLNATLALQFTQPFAFRSCEYQHHRSFSVPRHRCKRHNVYYSLGSVFRGRRRFCGLQKSWFSGRNQISSLQFLYTSWNISRKKRAKIQTQHGTLLSFLNVIVLYSRPDKIIPKN